MSTPFLTALNNIGDVARLYRMNETTGTAMIDSTANDADGVYSGATINQDPISLDAAARSVLFDGVDDDASQDPIGQLGGNLQPPWTLVAVVKTTQAARRVIAHWGRSSVRYGCMIGINADGTAWAGGTSTADSTAIVQAVSTATVNDGETHLIVGVFDDADTQRVYVDNNEAVSNTATIFSNTQNAADRLLRIARTIASHTGTNGVTLSQWLNANTEYVALINKTVTAAEVLTLYSALLPWAQLFNDMFTVADEAGGSPDNSTQLFDQVAVVHPTDSNLTASLTIANTAVADIDSALPSGWTDAGSGVYTATARTPSQMADDLQALSVAGALIGSTTATLVLTDTGAETSTVVVTLTCVDTDFSVVIADGGTFDFGSSPLDTPKSAQFRFVNEGSADWVIEAEGATVTGTGFSLDPLDDPSGATVTPGNETTVTVIFEPTTAGAKTGALSIAGNQDGSPYEINLTGVGGDATVVDGTGQGEADGTIRMVFTRLVGLWGDTITVDNDKITEIAQVTGGTRSFTVGSVSGAGGGTLQVIITPSPLIYSTASGGALTVTIGEGWLTDENGDTTAAFSGIADGDNSSTQEPAPPAPPTPLRLTRGRGGGSVSQKFTVRVEK